MLHNEVVGRTKSIEKEVCVIERNKWQQRQRINDERDSTRVTGMLGRSRWLEILTICLRLGIARAKGQALKGF